MFLWSYVQKAFLLSSRRLLGRRGMGCLLGCHCYSSASCPPPQLLPLICISHLYPWSTLLLTFLDYIFLTSAVHLFLTTVHCLFLYHPSNRLLFYHAPCMALCLFCCAPPMNDKCLCAAHWGTQAHSVCCTLRHASLRMATKGPRLLSHQENIHRATRRRSNGLESTDSTLQS